MKHVSKQEQYAVLESFWNLTQRHKYKAALRKFLLDKNDIFHEITTLGKLLSVLKNNANKEYEKYFMLFVLHNGLKEFMTEARNSRRWKDDKYHKNVMKMYDLLQYLLNNTQVAIDTYSINKKKKNMFELLIESIDIKSILGYPYFHSHLSLFWNYFMRSSINANEKRIRSEKVEYLLQFDFDIAIEHIYVSMHNPKHNDMHCVHRYRGLILQILCTLYYFFSAEIQYQYKLDDKQHIMQYIVNDYFILNGNHCNNYFLYSTETAIAKFISHAYNFQYFMNKMSELLIKNEKDKKSLINAQNMYRILLPFDIIVRGSHSRHEMTYYLHTLLNNLHRIWRENEENKIVKNRFLYLVNNDGNIDKKLGRYTCSDSNDYGCFEILSCHLMHILLKNYVISFWTFNKKYVLRRTNEDEIKQLLLCMLNALKKEESDSMPCTKHIQNAIVRLCNDDIRPPADIKKGINIKECNELKEEITKLNMSFIGQIPINVLNDIINYYQRTFLLSFSYCFPLDVHKLVISYCARFKSDAIINTIKHRQIILFDVSKQEYLLNIIDFKYVYTKKWMICRVKELLFGPMGRIIQILIKYRIDANDYGHLWINIKYIEWINKYQCWRYNIILNNNKKNIKCIFETDIGICLFESWWDMFVNQWIGEERKYINMNKKRN